ncbi:MAG: protoheme IX farnesyltransferase [Rhodospirillales bacterium]|nr:protoheme IX farnesyltransferase [Rhodospirillales bacterium]
MTAFLGDICSVLKLRIGAAIALTAVAGLAVTPGPAVPAWKVVLLAAAVLAASASAGAFNQYIERGTDALMRRTRNRPFVRGAFRAGPLWIAAIALLLLAGVGAAAAGLGLAAALHVFLGAFFYGVVYTVWLKRRTVLNIVIGGLAGSFAVLAGAATVDPIPGPVPLLFALTLFLWTPPHFWSLAMGVEEDYAAAGVPMLPVVVGDAAASWIILGHTAALVAVSLLPVFFGLGPLYGIAAATGGGYFLWKSIALVRAPTRKSAMANFHASLVQLSLLLAGAGAAAWSPP